MSWDLVTNLTCWSLLLEEKKKIRLEEAIERFEDHYITLLSPEDIYDKYQLNTPHSAIEHKYSAVISPVEYCRKLIEDGGFQTQFDCEIDSLNYDECGWGINDEYFDVVVVSSANESTDLLGNIPLRRVRGQLIYLPKEQLNFIPKTGLNFINYFGGV